MGKPGDAPKTKSPHPFHKLCGQNHRLGPCPQFTSSKPNLRAAITDASKRADAAGEKRKAKKTKAIKAKGTP